MKKKCFKNNKVLKNNSPFDVTADVHPGGRPSGSASLTF